MAANYETGELIVVKIVILAITVFLGSAIAHAEVIKIPIGNQAHEKQNIDRPQRGLSKIQVEVKYGAPQSIKDAIGEPPISSWNYETYVVFFENNRVIHAVLKHVAINNDNSE